jgi:LTXXQ motif family protein
MTFRPLTCGAVLAAALISVSAPPVLAQSAGTPKASAAGPSSAQRAAEARVETRIKQLHSQLHITAAQAAAWTEFAAVMRENARAIDEAADKRVAALPTMNAVQDLQSYEALAEAHVERLQKLIPAFVALYDGMSPAQKEIADSVFRGRAEHHQKHRG